MPTAKLNPEMAAPGPAADSAQIGGITLPTFRGEAPHQNPTPEIVPRGDIEEGEGAVFCFHGLLP